MINCYFVKSEENLEVEKNDQEYWLLLTPFSRFDNERGKTNVQNILTKWFDEYGTDLEESVDVTVWRS